MRRSWIYLSGLVLLASMWYGPGFVSGAHWANPGERALVAKAVGPFTAILVEPRTIPPRPDPYGRRLKDYTLVLSPAGAKAVKAAYLRVGKPRKLRAAGTLLDGNPYRLHAHLPFPETYGPDDAIWLTVETWSGEVHQVSWPLGQAMASLSEPLQSR